MADTLITGTTIIEDKRNESTSVPIGSIVAWLKSFSNTPSIPGGWVECNGAVLSDADSVYNGQTLPDLNGNNQFPRGNSTSGGTGGSSTHILLEAEMPIHTHNALIGSSSSIIEDTGSGLQVVTSVTFGASGTAGSGEAHENKPPYYEVVWIMKIK